MDFARGGSDKRRRRASAGPRRVVGAEADDFGSNAQRQAALAQQQAEEQTQGQDPLFTDAAVAMGARSPAQPVTDTAGTDTAKADAAKADAAKTDTAKADEEQVAVLDRLGITRTLRVGSKGKDVEALQRFLGLEGDDVDGDFGSGTKKRVMAWQEEQGMKADGIVGLGTVAKMRGDELIYGYSWHHDPEKFVPAFPMTAYHESGIYRGKDDPYAVGAVTNPRKDQDLGGKTYGAYQFESYVYRDGTSAEQETVDGSTVMRFVNWKDNPYSERMKAVVKEHGIASAEFDALWKSLAKNSNKAFGQAQEAFLRHDKAGAVAAFFDRAKVSKQARTDTRLVDLIIGTTNHVGTLADSVADHLAALREQKDRDLTVEEIGKAVTDFKKGRVSSWFRSSPKAQDGIKARFDAERTVFE